MAGVLTGAGAVMLMGGLLALFMSISIREFSFGSTLMIVGAISAASGLVVVALAQILREVRKLSAPQVALPATTARPEFPPRPAVPPTATVLPAAASAHDTPFSIPPRAAPVAPPPRPEPETPPAAAPDTRAASKRNLMFRRQTEASAPSESGPEAAPDASWPQPAARPPEGLWKRRRRETLPPPAEPMLDLPGNEASAEAPAVTVLKSGVVDGMGYTLFSDGSIEAQLAEGTVRFASIEALRAHLDQRES